MIFLERVQMRRFPVDSVVLVAIETLLNEGRNCSHRSIEKEFSVDRNTVTRCVKTLEEQGRIQITRRGYGYQYQYQVLDPPNDFDRAMAELYQTSVSVTAMRNGGD